MVNAIKWWHEKALLQLRSIAILSAWRDLDAVVASSYDLSPSYHPRPERVYAVALPSVRAARDPLD